MIEGTDTWKDGYHRGHGRKEVQRRHGREASHGRDEMLNGNRHASDKG